jgi:hypothetical protein
MDGGCGMSGWHRENPELVGTDADPWMMHESYRRACEELRVGVFDPERYDDGEEGPEGPVQVGESGL